MTVLDLIVQSERETLRLRLLALLTVAVAMLIYAQSVPLVPILALVGGYLGYTYALRVFLIPRFLSYALGIAMLLIDAGVLLAALYIAGVNTPVFALLPIAVVSYSIYLGYAGGIAMATVSTAGYVGLSFLTGESERLGSLLAVQVPLFYVLALLGGYVTQQRLRETEERRALQRLIDTETHARVLLNLTQTLRDTLDVEVLAKDFARMGALLARVPVFLVFLLDEEKGQLVCYGATGEQPTGNDGRETERTESSDGPSFIGQAWRTGALATFPGQEPSGGPLPAWLAELNLRRGIAVPLAYEGRHIGVAAALDLQPGPFDEETLATFVRFTEATSGILGKLRLYGDTERQSSRVVAELQQDIRLSERLREQSGKRTLRFGSLVIEPTREMVRFQDTRVRLSRMEFDLLYLLAERANTVVSQETLLREVWGKDYVPQGKVVDVAVHRLRKKLEVVAHDDRLIRTVRGQGYTFVPPRRATRASA